MFAWMWRLRADDSFGAVVEREQFERSCFETFVVGKVFQSESIGFAS